METTVSFALWHCSQLVFATGRVLLWHHWSWFKFPESPPLQDPA